jgi:carbon monoxide dehydrogenase subunit G
MRTFETTIDIAAPPAQVWAVMSDVERWHEWTASITAVRRLDDGPMRVGSRAHVKQPKLAGAVFEVSSWQPERGFDWVTRSPGIAGLARHLVEPTTHGSRVTLSVTFSGPLSGLLALVFGGLTDRYIRMEAAGLKRRVESP